MSFLLSSPKFASSTPLEVANEAQTLDNPILGDNSAGRLGTNKHEPKVGQDQVYKLDVDDARKKRYAMVFVLAVATGLRCSELFALRLNDINFKEGTVRVDESADQRT
ncbi:MAG: hypothetical protein DMG55_32485 [Acidobacteria bacterium]|nr:MAG: hypothetical protein DMG55_32485 [Acidobacteriota bacterium]